jgi:hypothetical protein
MIAEGTTTYEQVLQLLADGEWHTEDELAEISYFPREWIRELKASGEHVTTVENGKLRLRLDTSR